MSSTHMSWRPGSRDDPQVRQPATVLVIETTRLYRDGLAQLLSKRRDIRVAAAATLQEALIVVRDALPAVILVSAAARDSGIILKGVTGAAPEARSIIIGLSEERGDEIVALAECGAAGFFPQDGSMDDLHIAIDTVLGGGVFCPPRIANILLRGLTMRVAEDRSWPARSPLTFREREVLQLLRVGLSNKEIALRLRIRISTVKNHVHKIFEKLEIRHRYETIQRVQEEPSGRTVP